MRKSSRQGQPAQSEETGEDAGEESNEFAVFRSLTSGRFRVEEFRLPLLKGTIQPPSQPLVNANEARSTSASSTWPAAGPGCCR